MSDLELRPIGTKAEEEAYAACLGAAFGTRMPPDVFLQELEVLGRDHTLAAFEENEIVGTSAWFPLELTLPGGGVAAGAGVTSVTTLPTHRRRGVLTALMRRQLAEFVEAGLTVSLLTASEAGIYGRFGYGVATHKCRYTLDKRLARLRPSILDTVEVGETGGSIDAGRVRLVTAAAASKIFAEVWDAARRLRPGEVSFPSGFWAPYFGPQPAWREVDQDKRFLAVYEEDGEVLACIDYQVADRPGGRVVDLELLIWTTLRSYVAMWRYLIGIDLVPTIATRQRPVDEPLRNMLTDSRLLEMSAFQDSLWVRPLDLVRLLESRRYAPGRAGRLSLLVRDSLFPQLAGVYSLEVDDEGTGSVTRLGDGDGGVVPADLELDVAEVGAVVLGGVSVASLRQAGLVGENTPGAVWRADSWFATDVPPFLTIGF